MRGAREHPVSGKQNWARALLVLYCGALTLCVAEPKQPASPARIVAEQAYDEAQSHFQTNRSDNTAAWQFARACFELADLSTIDSERAALAHRGIDACREVLKRDPSLAAAHYYLGMNLGQLAQTKSLGALSLVRQMQKEWNAALALDKQIDFAGPDRNLGVLYRDAPGSPLSIGNHEQAVAHMKRAVELSPEYPENRLNLIESQIQWRQYDAAAGENDELHKVLPAARKQLTGPHWRGPWKDWQERMDAIDARLKEWRGSSARRAAP